MKRQLVAAVLALALSACAQQFDLVVPDGKPAISSLQFGGIGWTASGRPVLSGSANSIPAGQPGDGGAAAP